MKALPSSALLLHATHHYDELEELVAKAIDRYVARYDGTAEMSKVSMVTSAEDALACTLFQQSQEREILKDAVSNARK